MTNSNYNLCFLVLIIFTNNIRSENDLYDHSQSKKLRKFKSIIYHMYVFNNKSLVTIL